MATDSGNGVYTFDHEPAEGKDVVVVTQRGAVVVDTGNEPADGRELTEFVRERGLPLAFVILTHGHGDHIFGWPAIGQAEVIATRGCQDVIAHQRPLFERRFGRPPGPADLPAPTFLVDGVLEIDCGDCRLELMPTPGHSPDSQSIWIPERQTLICGDTVVTAIPVAINEGDSRELEASVDLLAGFDASLLVGGHGEPLRGNGEVREWLSFQATYLREIRRRVRVTLEESGPDAPDFERRLLDACPMDELLESRFDEARYKMPERHANVVRKIAREEAV